MSITEVPVGETIEERNGWKLWRDRSGLWYMSDKIAYRLTGHPKEEPLTDDEVIQRFKDGHYDNLM